MHKYSIIKSSARKTKKRIDTTQLLKAIFVEKKDRVKIKGVVIRKNSATCKVTPSCVGRSMSVSGAMSIYGKMYNQEEEDVDKAINSLAKYIK